MSVEVELIDWAPHETRPPKSLMEVSMAHNKGLSFILAVILVMVSFMMLLHTSGASISSPNHYVQGGSSLIKADFATNVIHDLITCDGCSGGGNGPG